MNVTVKMKRAIELNIQLHEQLMHTIARERDAVLDNSGESVGEILAERESLVSEINRLNDIVMLYAQTVDPSQSELPDDLAALFSRLRDVMQDAAATAEHSVETLRGEKDSISKQLTGMGARKRAVGQYMRNAG